MPSMFQQKSFQWSFLIFCILNSLLYLWIFFFHAVIPFNIVEYQQSAYHFIQDPQAIHKGFSIITGLAQWDSQWYIKVAKAGYPTRPNYPVAISSYVFFPLVPLLIRWINILIDQILVAGFLYSIIFLIGSFCSLYYVITTIYSQKIAFKTSFLCFFSPLSIFYRGYYAVSLFSFLVIWFTYFLIKKKYVKSAIFLGLLNITSGSGLLLNILFLCYMIKEIIYHQIDIKERIYSAIAMAYPLCLWIIFCWIKTGNPLYFYLARNNFQHLHPFPYYLFVNLLSMIHLWNHPLFSISKLEIVTMWITLGMLLASIKILPKKIWWVGFLLWINPLIVQTTISFLRFQSVIFPLYLLLALKSNKKVFIILFISGYISLLIVALFFVNWYWIG